jgi:hypothetical protein
MNQDIINQNHESEIPQVNPSELTTAPRANYVKPMLEQHHNWKALVGQLTSGGITKIPSLGEN